MPDCRTEDTHPDRPSEGKTPAGKSEAAACLLRRARQGDRTAFDLLTEPLRLPLLRFAGRLLGVRDAATDAEDLVADAFHALYLNLSRLESPDTIRWFLYRVVRNRAYDQLRKHGRFTTVSFDDAAFPGERSPVLIAPASLRPDAALERLLVLSEVQRAIDRLPEHLREVLLLYSEEDFTYEEIAATLLLSAVVVKSRIFQARRHLRRLLSPETLRAVGVAEPTQKPIEK